ncbi:MAG TPA: SGNH/GDSL hydrolase family protein [Sphingomonas sp.]|jgi:hypothetical protein
MTQETRLTYLILGVVIGFLVTSAVAFGYIHWWKPSAIESYVFSRSKNLLSQAQATGKVDTLVIGDSIVEGNSLTDLCGVTFGAGVGGGNVADLTKIAPDLIAATRPDRIVVALGTNDVLQRKAEGQAFEQRYLALLASLPVKPFALVGVLNGPNDFIQRTASAIGAAYVTPLPANLLKDGIHPNLAGLKVWRDQVARACPEK